MTRTSLVMILATTLTGSFGCAKDSPSGDSLTTQPGTSDNRAVPPPTETQPTVVGNEIRFSHTRYPSSAIADRGTLGEARGGMLTNTQGKQYDIKSSWESGSAVVVFYRGHW